MKALWAVGSAGRVVRGEVGGGGEDDVEGGEEEVRELGEVELNGEAVLNGEVGDGRPELPG